MNFWKIGFFQGLNLQSAFYVDTALKLTECTTDVEVMIKQVNSCVSGHF